MAHLRLHDGRAPRRRWRSVFRFILISPDDQPYEPPTFLTASAQWSVGDEISPGHGGSARILDVDTDLHQHVRALGFTGVFTVEPVRRAA